MRKSGLSITYLQELIYKFAEILNNDSSHLPCLLLTLKSVRGQEERIYVWWRLCILVLCGQGEGTCK